MRRKRASITAVFIGIDRVLRVDLDDRGVLIENGRVERTLGAVVPLEEGLEIALHADVEPAPRVVVAAETLWTQTVDVSRASIQGLSTVETARALAFEAEPLSNIPASDAALAYTLVGSHDGARETAWITVLRAADRAALEKHLRERGSRLAALVHPCGLAPAESPARVEVWERATCCIDAGPPARTLVIAARAGQRSWEKALSDWLANVRTGPITWTGRARATSLTSSARAIDDRGPGAFHAEWPEWLASIANAALRNDAAVPVVRPAPRARRTIEPGVLCAILCVLAIAFSVWRQRGSEVRAAEIEDKAGRAEQMRADLEEAKSVRAGLVKKVEELRARLAAANTQADAIETEWNAQSKRWLALASEVSLRKPAGITIVAVEPDSQGGAEVRGVGLDPQTIQDYAASLEPGLAAAAWKPRPARSTEKYTRDGRAYFEFTIGVEQPSSARVTGAAASSTTKPARRARVD